MDFLKNLSSFNDHGWNIFVSSPVKQWPRTRFECVSSLTMTAVLKSFLTCSSPWTCLRCVDRPGRFAYILYLAIGVSGTFRNAINIVRTRGKFKLQQNTERFQKLQTLNKTTQQCLWGEWDLFHLGACGTTLGTVISLTSLLLADCSTRTLDWGWRRRTFCPLCTGGGCRFDPAPATAHRNRQGHRR